MRGLSELYSALILLGVSLILLPAVLRVVTSYYEEASKTSIRPVKVANINSTYALCYSVGQWDTRPWREKLSNMTVYVFINDTDRDGLLDPTPYPYPIVPPGRYLLVSPPWLCRG